jgi:hypothetical protein
VKIAILGWGSLIWDDRPEFDELHDQWLPDGPQLSLEFSRVSKTRHSALTLVIDEQHGEECVVNYALSRRHDLDDAISDLRCREGTVHRRIGHFVAEGSRSGDPTVPDAIKSWLEERQLDAAVWTGLASNFLDTTGQAFSIPNAIEHLQSLPSEGKAKAAEYIWRAPNCISTPLRRALEIEPWFATGKQEPSSASSA